MNDLICIAGPTASGKTGLAVALAKALNGEVVSCDSMQIYRGMDVGTAKPTPEEMQGVPHHLLDVADPGEDFSVGRYVRLATEAITDIHSRGRTAIVAGGTGLYLDSLVKGEEFAPPSREGERKFLEDAAEQKGIEYVYDMLMEADPETAERLHLSDRKRIIRAMEVFLITGLPLSWHIAHPHTTAMQAIGYKELASSLRGECTVEEAASRIKQASRNYAKRQLTWFRRNDKIRWIYPDETPDLLQRALKLLAREPD